MTPIVPSGSWSAVQMWARAIAPCEVPQIQGFAISRNALAGCLSGAGVDEVKIRPVRLGSPAEVSAALLVINDKPVIASLNEGIPSRFAARLQLEAQRIDATFKEPPLSELLPRRRQVSSDLGMKLLPGIAGSSEMERRFIAQTRASLASNEAVPFVARYLSTRAIERLRAEITAAVPKERAPDVIVAAEIYLKLLGF